MSSNDTLIDKQASEIEALVMERDALRVIQEVATKLMRYLNESPGGCPVCGVEDGEHADDMPCADLYAVLP